VPGRWAKIQVVEAASADSIQFVTGRIPREMGPSVGLSYGRTGLREGAFEPCQTDGPWPTTPAQTVSGQDWPSLAAGGRRAFHSAIMGRLAMGRPVPGRTGDERESLVAAGVRGSSVHCGPRIVPSAGQSTKPSLAEPLASFAHGAFLKFLFFSVGRAKIQERIQMSPPHDNWY